MYDDIQLRVEKCRVANVIAVQMKIMMEKQSDFRIVSGHSLHFDFSDQCVDDEVYRIAKMQLNAKRIVPERHIADKRILDIAQSLFPAG